MYPKSKLNRFGQLWAEGATFPKIMEELNICRSTVAKWRKECGFPPRKRGPRKGIRRSE